MAKTIDICCDMGEGYGNWRYGDDEAIMPYISSVNLACGGHAGDPMIMDRTIDLAVAHGIAVGAHPGFPDMLNFGRRVIAFEPSEFASILTYQIGALQAFLKVKGQTLHHVLPHGATYHYLRDSDAAGEAAAHAIHALAPDTIITFPSPTTVAYTEALRSLGHSIVPLLIADMRFGADGVLRIEKKKAATDLNYVRAQVRSVLEEELLLTDGDRIRLREPITGILLHSDGPNAVDVAKAIRSEVEACGYTVRAT